MATRSAIIAEGLAGAIALPAAVLTALSAVRTIWSSDVVDAGLSTPWVAVLVSAAAVLGSLAGAVQAASRTANGPSGRLRGHGMVHCVPTQASLLREPSHFERRFGWSLVLLAVASALCILVATALPWARGDGLSQDAIAALPVLVPAVVGLIGPALAGGIGLLRGAAWGRGSARLASLVLLLVFPAGTVFGAVGLLGLRQRYSRREDPRWRAQAAALERQRQAYQADREATRTCTHLADAERAMRRAGIPVALVWGHHVRAQCLADRDVLTCAAARMPPVVLQAGTAPETPGAPQQRLVLSCPACKASITIERGRRPFPSAEMVTDQSPGLMH